MSESQLRNIAELSKCVIYFVSALGMGICLYRRQYRGGAWPEKLLVGGLLAMGLGTLMSLGWLDLTGIGGWSRVVGDLLFVNAGTAVTIFAVYLLTLKFHFTALKLKTEAETDPVTSLYNRRAFLRELLHRFEKGGEFAVAILDLDNMKQVNDTLGHQEGDEVLRAASRALKSSIRRDDVAARYGGDEFAVLFINQGPPLEKFRLRLERNLSAELASFKGVMVSFSVGLAYYPEDGKDVDSLLTVADARMYAEKEARKAGSGRQLEVPSTAFI